MTDPPKVKAEDVISQAEAVALYFRTLVDEGVPLPAATQMASAYVGAVMMAFLDAQKPATPWDEP